MNNYVAKSFRIDVVKDFAYNRKSVSQGHVKELQSHFCYQFYLEPEVNHAIAQMI